MLLTSVIRITESDSSSTISITISVLIAVFITTTMRVCNYRLRKIFAENHIVHGMPVDGSDSVQVMRDAYLEHCL